MQYVTVQGLNAADNHTVPFTGFIRSGKIRGKHIFFEMVRESQGVQRKSQEKVEKSQGDFFGKLKY